jgi:hypothetical protein
LGLEPLTMIGKTDEQIFELRIANLVFSRRPTQTKKFDRIYRIIFSQFPDETEKHVSA